MFPLVIFAVTFLPLLGIYSLECGAYGIDIHESGYPNGATQAYAIHFAAFWVVFLATMLALSGGGQHGLSVNKSVTLIKPPQVSAETFSQLATWGLIFQILFCLFSFGPLGAYKVLLFGANRGEFRASFGSIGILAYFQAYYLSPMMCALVAALFVQREGRQGTLLMVLNCFFTAANIGMWGYRAAAIISLLPAFIVLFPRVRLTRMALLGGFSVCILVASQIVFQGSEDVSTATEVLWQRATVGAGSVAWKTWDLHRSGIELPSFWPTLWSVIPNRVNEAIGLYTRGSHNWYDHDFTAMMTAITGDYHRNIDARTSNVTSTVFCSGLLAFGSPAYVIMSAFAGLLAGVTQRWVEQARRVGNHVMLAFAATYAVRSVWAFLNNGDPICIFTVAAGVYYVLSFYCCAFLLHAVQQRTLLRKSTTLAAGTRRLTPQTRFQRPLRGAISPKQTRSRSSFAPLQRRS